MGGTDVLREDHQAIRAALGEVGDVFAVGMGQVAAMRERYEELTHAIARHLKAEEEVLAPRRITLMHHREQDQLQAVQAKLEHLSQDAEAVWSALSGLVKGVRQDMWSEELDLFPTVERLESIPPGPRPEVRQALAERRPLLRRPAAKRVSALFIFGVILAGSLVMSPRANREEVPPAWKDFSATVLGPVPGGHQVAMAARLTVEYRGRIMPMSKLAREALAMITAASPQDADEAVWVVLAIMADPARWQDRELVWVPPGPLRRRLGVAPGATHQSYRQLAAWSSFAQADQESLDRLLQSAGDLTPMEREWLLLHQRFVTLRLLLEQDVCLVPFPGGRVEHRLPILNPEGYAFEIQIGIKRAWSALLDAVRSGEPAQTREAARKLSGLLRHCEVRA